MAEFEKSSNDGSIPDKRALAQALDQRRRAALAEIDNAGFSFV
jgi:hypothetical protein